MIYTELGNGKKKRLHETEGTARAAYEVGDMPRDDMATYAEEVCKRHHGRSIQAYEIRVSFSPDELKAGNKSDEQMAGEHGYKLCKKLYPNSMCYVTVHNDGKGGCVHAHCLVVNNDEKTGKALNDNLRHFNVKDASDELAAEEGLSVIGTPKFERDRLKEGTTWDKRRSECSSFEQRLGDKVQRARDSSDTLDEFKQHLHWAGVELMEQKRKGKDGIEHEAWCYKMEDIESPKHRKRRRKAKLLADDLTKDGIESYYAEKALESQNKAQEHVKPKVVPIEQEKPSEGEYEPLKAHIEPEATYSLLDDYKVDSEDVKTATEALASQYRRRKGDVLGDAVYSDMRHAQGNVSETTAKLQADVDAARAQFKADKAAVDELRGQKAPNLYGLKQCFKIAGNRKDKSQFERMLDDMFAQMLVEIMCQTIEEQQLQAREDAEKRLYESRKDMWDAEKRLRAANSAIDHETSRTSGRRATSRMQDAYEADKAAYKTDSEQYE
ncbi:MAG: relaxase/mobilization nuclease domain-containing protein [Scardovia wiggsiae]|nr:relaxase/mobilization nuclease domain-containing protein [Scardovia wiggsiae]